MRLTRALAIIITCSLAANLALAKPGQRHQRWKSINKQARRLGFGTSNQGLARVLRTIRHAPSAVNTLRSSFNEAFKTPGNRKSLQQYLTVRGDSRSFLTSTLTRKAISTRGKEPAVKFMIGGNYRSSRTLDPVLDPFSGKSMLRMYASSASDVKEAITLAHGARNKTAAIPIKTRARILRNVATQLKARRGDLARVMALESGKPIADAQVEVDRAINTFKLAAKEATKLKPRIEQTPSGKMRIERTPIGVISAITPFNFPLNLVAHKVAPAIASGNPVIIKPSPRTPLTSMMLAEMITRTAWPKQAISVVTPRVSNITPLIKDPRVKMVSFTGSETIGWNIKKKAADKRVALELGGNAALVVHKDADLKDAVKKAVRGAFAYSGQVCISTQRIMIHESLYPRFVKEFTRQTRQLKMGDPLHPGTQVGPMINRASVDRIKTWLSEARAGGAKILTGGKNRGNFLQPTVVVNARSTDKIVREEVFGPVVVLSSYKKVDSALKDINASRFGLQAGIFTKDQKLIERAYRKLEVGGLVVNHVPTIRFDSQPYGGIKRSGSGREGPRFAVEEMTEYKTLLMPGQK